MINGIEVIIIPFHYSNLFETGLVFALGFMVFINQCYEYDVDMFNPDKSAVTTEKRRHSIMVKDGKKTTIRRMTKNLGAEMVVGTAYRLEDGSVIYVLKKKVEKKLKTVRIILKSTMNKFIKHLGSVFIVLFAILLGFFVWRKTSQNPTGTKTLPGGRR